MAHPPYGAEPQHIDIELSEEVAEGRYANLVMIAHSAEEFVLDFIRIMPGLPKARVQSRIIITPTHAKRLLRALADNIGRYEATYGEIEVPEPGQPVHFGGMGGEA
jgi:hypothetical protein